MISEPEEGDYRKGILNLIDLGNVDMAKFEFGKVNGMCGKAAYEYIAKCIELANKGKVDAVATTPINKAVSYTHLQQIQEIRKMNFVCL